MPSNGCLKTARSKANTEDAFPFYTLPSFPQSASGSGTLGPEKGIQTIIAWRGPPFQEFAQLLFWSDLDFHPLLQPMVKFHSFITCPASLICTNCLGFLQFLHLPFAPTCDFNITVTPLQLTLTQAKQGSAIRSIPSMEIFRQRYLHLQSPHLTF